MKIHIFLIFTLLSFASVLDAQMSNVILNPNQINCNSTTTINIDFDTCDFDGDVAISTIGAPPGINFVTGGTMTVTGGIGMFDLQTLDVCLLLDLEFEITSLTNNNCSTFVGDKIIANGIEVSCSSFSKIEELKLIASDAGAKDQYGISVSTDGNRILVGADRDKDNGFNTGAAYLYDWTGTSWVETKLAASDGGAGKYFGRSVSIDGDRAAVGSISGPGSLGSVYLYDWNGTTWVETKLMASDGVAGNNFGQSVQVELDRIVVGAPWDDDNGPGSGSMYIYDWDGSSWVESKISASDGFDYDFFGHSIGVSGDRIVVGAYQDDDNSSASGSAYIFDWDGSNWVETKLTASDGANGDYFGEAVSVDADRVLVGARWFDAASINTGSAYVYDWDGSNWVETKLLASDKAGDDEFGCSVSVSGDKLLIGSRFDDDNVSNSGSGYVFEWDGSSWVETKLIASDGSSSDELGTAVSISGDMILISAVDDSDFLPEFGSVYFFDLAQTSYQTYYLDNDGDGYGDPNGFVEVCFPPTSYVKDSSDCDDTDPLLNAGEIELCDGIDNDCDGIIDDVYSALFLDNEDEKLVASNGLSFDNLGYSVSVDGDRIVSGAPFVDLNGSSSGSVYLYDWDGTNWIESILNASDASSGDEYGISVSVSGDRIVVGSHRDFDNGVSSGSIYIYDWDGSNWIETKVMPSDGSSSDRFGRDVRIDGDRIIVGSPVDDDNGNASGSVYIYDWDGSNWIETKLTPSDGKAIDEFGQHVAIDGDRAAVGAKSGFYIYDLVGSVWVETKPFLTDYIPQPSNVLEVAISGDRVVVGNHKDVTFGSQSGVIHVFDLIGGNWSETKIWASDSDSNDLFGWTVSIDQDQIAVGARGDEDNGSFSGSSYVYVWDGIEWLENKIAASDGISSDLFGTVSINSNRIAVGAPGDDDNGSSTGSVYVFEIEEYSTFYADSDGDGYGDVNTTIESCTVPAGFVTDDTDCDDTDPTVYPNAPELCDGLDNDCDGIIENPFVCTNCPSGLQINTCLGTQFYWGAASNWSLGTIPTICDHVIIPNGISVTLLNGSQAECYTIDVALTGELTMQGGTLHVVAPGN